jgi:predicted O-methyltransferase YrrM
MLMTANRRLRELVGILETTNVLFLRLAAQRNPNAKGYLGRVFREYMYLGGAGHWRSESIFQFFPELVATQRRIVLEHVENEELATPVNELALMALATQAVQPSTIFEIGTYRGRTALNFALNSPDNCRVYTLDLPPAHEQVSVAHLSAADQKLVSNRQPGRDFDGADVQPKITQLLGDSTQFDFEPYASAVDLVFVDGGHTYDIASSDTRAARMMCRPGGVIMWHDWGNYGDYHDVMRAVLDQLPASEVVQLENTLLAAYRKPLA